MRAMILDTSSPNLFISFVEDGKEIFKRVLKTVNNHSELFLDNLKEGLDLLGLEVKDFDKVIVGIGPGSYTGLRVSLTVAKTFCWAMNIELYTVNSLYVLGSGYFNCDGKYAICNIAKKNHYYYQLLEVKDGNVFDTIEARFSSIDEFNELMVSYPEHKVITFDDFSYSGVNITNLSSLELIENIHPLVPNYLRKDI